MFVLITFVVNMIYLQIFYQCEALQIPKIMLQKVLQLAYNEAMYGFTKIPFLWSIIFVLINYRQLLLYISYEYACTCLSLQRLFLQQLQGKGELNTVYCTWEKV